MNERRWCVVVVHEDAEVADRVGGRLRHRGFEVAWSWSYEAAVKRIEAWPADIVLTAWDRPLGQRAYRWALRRELGRRFAFVVDQMVPRLERAESQRRVARLDDLHGVMDVVLATRRHVRAAELAHARAKPSRLLLVEDDPDQRAAMTDVLRASGYDVVAADGVRSAVAALETSGAEAVLSDWSMADGTGVELRNWIAVHRPELLGALVFITGGDTTCLRDTVWPVPVLPKGQDSQSLVAVLSRAVEAGRGTTR